jgi:hypothetical protein
MPDNRLRLQTRAAFALVRSVTTVLKTTGQRERAPN